MDNESININENTKTSEPAEQITAGVPLSITEIVARIDEIMRQSEHITQAMHELSELKAVGPGDIAGSAKAQAIQNIVTAREETNRRLIDFYTKLYDDAKPKGAEQKSKIELIAKMFETLSERGLLEANLDEFGSMIDTLRFMN